MASKIEWLLGGDTWNPIRAKNRETGGVGHFCVKVDDACRNCYAEAYQHRVKNHIRFAAQDLKLVEPFLDPVTIKRPLSWRTARMIFPCSMTDLFAEWHPDAWIDAVVAVAALTPQHTYQVLTKRAERMRDYFIALAADEREGGVRLERAARGLGRTLMFDGKKLYPWPLKNWWQGVSAGTQAGADERIPKLLDAPVRLRWVSFEPLIEEVSVSKYLRPDARGRALDWGVVGGESGMKARGTDIDNLRFVIGQHRISGKPIFCKQLGKHPFTDTGDHVERLKLNNVKGGEMSEWPEDLRIREMPKCTE